MFWGTYLIPVGSYHIPLLGYLVVVYHKVGYPKRGGCHDSTGSRVLWTLGFMDIAYSQGFQKCFIAAYIP